MIHLVDGPLISHPTHWVLAFSPVAPNWWIGALAWGRYKHVRAYGYVPFLHVWVFVDATFAGLEVILAAKGPAANAMIATWAAGCDLVVMRRQVHANRSVFTAASGWCVPAMKRLIGLRSRALRPDALFRDCLTHDGLLFANTASRAGTAGAGDAAGSGVAARAGADDAGAGPGLHAPAG